MTGPKEEWLAPVLVQAMVWASCFVWSVTGVPYFWIEVDSHWATLFGMYGYVHLAIFEYCFLRAQYMDPGVMFREIVYEDEEAGFPSESTIMQKERQMAENDKIRQGAHIYKPRYCNTCNIIKPVKASHCGMCNNCVMEFDHHCTFINNCVGRRNIKYFFGILLLVMVGAVYAVAAASMYLFLVVMTEVPDMSRLYVAGPIIVVTTPVLIHAFQISWMTTWRIVRTITSLIIIFSCAIYIIRFPKWYVNVLPIAFLIHPVLFMVMLWDMFKEYAWLLSRNMTEKEKCSRDRFVVTSGINDDVLNQDLP
jgi:hypothetical protein